MSAWKWKLRVAARKITLRIRGIFLKTPPQLQQLRPVRTKYDPTVFGQPEEDAKKYTDYRTEAIVYADCISLADRDGLISSLLKVCESASSSKWHLRENRKRVLGLRGL